MKLREDIYKTIKKNKGIITTEDFLSLGLSRTTLGSYVKCGLLERVERGVYSLPDVLSDDMFVLSLHSENIVFSHESAAFLNGISNRTPFIYTITLPSDKLIPHSLSGKCTTFYIKRNLYKLGLTKRRTIFGNFVKCYNSERAICDLIRSKRKIDDETILTSLDEYLYSRNKNVKLLQTYAKKFKIEETLKNYVRELDEHKDTELQS